MAVGRGRIDECPPVPAEDMQGSAGENYLSVNLPTVGYENPGATPNLRGVEPNTGRWDEAGNSYDVPGEFLHGTGSVSNMDDYPTQDDPHSGVGGNIKGAGEPE